MSKDQLLGIVRHVATAGVGFVVAKGWIDDSLAAQIVTAVVGLAALAHSYFSKRAS